MDQGDRVTAISNHQQQCEKAEEDFRVKGVIGCCETIKWGQPGLVSRRLIRHHTFPRTDDRH
jgi:hypothetical protein